MSFVDRLQHAWNAFNGTPDYFNYSYGQIAANRPDKPVLSYTIEQSIISSIYTRIAIDVAAVSIQHVKVDENGMYLETMKSGLNECLTVSANADQSAYSFIIDAVLSLLDEGCVAIVPVDTDINPSISNGFDILSLRTGKIVEWMPEHVRIKVFNDRIGDFQEIVMLKRSVAIVENPFYYVMNEPNSTLKRLSRKLYLLDAVDEQSSSGKLDLILQLPYVIKSKAREEQAAARKKSIEMQLTGSKYGIAYIDGTERITQLNRPVDNNLMNQIEYLTGILYNQLGMTESVFDGSADEQTMLNYYNRSIEPILDAITKEMNRKYLTKTARTQGQRIIYIRNPFKLVPSEKMAELVDKYSRNEVLSSNELRAIIGYKPVDDPRANELRNKNLNQSAAEMGQEDLAENEASEEIDVASLFES